MPQSPVSKLYAVEDCRIYKLTADPAGGSPTYATGIDVPGIKEVAIGGTVNTKQLRGDNGPLDQNSTLGDVTLSVSHAKIATTVLAVLLGGAVTDTGTTPNMVSTYLLTKATTLLSYFKLEAKTPTGGGDSPTGDIHWIAHKCILTSFPSVGLAEEDYRIVSFEAVAIPLISNGNHLSEVNNETAVAIAG